MRTGRWAAAAAVIAGLSVLGGPAPALAQPAVSPVQREAARQNYKEASIKFEHGDYAGAVGLFEEAEAIAPIWQTKFKIAVCHDKLGHAAEAVRWYRAFLDSNPPAKLAAPSPRQSPGSRCSARRSPRRPRRRRSRARSASRSRRRTRRGSRSRSTTARRRRPRPPSTSRPGTTAS